VSLPFTETLTGAVTNQLFNPSGDGTTGLTVGGVESTFIVLEIVDEFPALSTVRKFTVYVPFVREALACQAPPLTDTCALARPDMASDPLVDIATGEVLCQPFVPFTAG
jgi:hypothetical protein